MKPHVQALIEDFSLFDNWEDRYRYLIDIGRNLPPMDAALKTDDTLVRGCTSQVWMVSRVEGGRFHFTADSDAHIVRGLIALLMKIYEDQPVEEVRAIDIEQAFSRIGLDQHLSPNRRSGFFAMVERIREQAVA